MIETQQRTFPTELFGATGGSAIIDLGAEIRRKAAEDRQREAENNAIINLLNQLGLM